MDLRKISKTLAAAALLAATVVPAQGTTLLRMGLEELTSSNQMVVLGEVIDSYSYWNSAGTFILTDVRMDVLETLKGNREGKKELVVTLMGGTVGDLTTLIVAGAELVPETTYVLFLDEENLPGADGVLTVRDHSQGVFEVSVSENGSLRGASQANGHHLVPDETGSTLAPGGFEGLPLDTLMREVREITAKQSNGGR